jgi:hypothetical protein
MPRLVRLLSVHVFFGVWWYDLYGDCIRYTQRIAFDVNLNELYYHRDPGISPRFTLRLA